MHPVGVVQWGVGDLPTDNRYLCHRATCRRLFDLCRIPVPAVRVDTV
jgi:hypothetical protein